MTQIPRPEHPQPQMKREHWKNLNGEWDFSFDFGCSGIDQKWQGRKDRLGEEDPGALLPGK